MADVEIGYEDVESTGLVPEESLSVWLENGWFVVEPEEEEEPPVKFVTNIDGDEETLVPETPLPDEKESDQVLEEESKEF